jgi:hypothetical protein
MIYGFASATAAYVVQAVLMAAALGTFLGIRYVARTRDPEASAVEAGSLLSGLRFVRRQPILLGALTLDLFSVLLAGSEALLPVFADRILHVGPQGLGLLRAAPAGGSVLMSVYLAHRPPFQQAGRTLLLAVTAFAVCIIGFGLSRSVALSAALLLLRGMADNVSVLIRSTMLQMFTPSHLFGRFSAVNSIFIGSSNEIGAFESGLAARLIGVVPAVLFGGFAALGVVGAVAATNPTLRKLRTIGAAAAKA